MAAPRSPTPAGSAETTAGSAPAGHADAADTSARRPAGSIGATGSTDGPLSPASARPAALVRPTAAASATAGPLAAGAAPAEGVRRGADRRDAKTATAAPRTPAPRGRAHHRVALAGCTGDTGSRATAGSAAACHADAAATASRRPDNALGATGTASPLAAVNAAAAGPAQAEGVRRGADRRDTKTATAAPRTPAPRGRAHHRVALAGCTGDTGSRATAGSAAACHADAAAGTSSRRPDNALGATGTASPLAAVNAAAAGPAQAEGVRRGADRRDTKTATAAPRTPGPRGHARHTGTGDNGSRSPSPASGGQDRSAGGTSGAAQRRWRAGTGGPVLHR